MKQESDFIPYNAIKTVAKGKTLVFAPHPDDEVFGCGGAIIRHNNQGDIVKVVIVTDGGFPVNEQQDVPEYKKIRKEESRNAAKILAYGEPEFLEYPDRGLKFDEKLINHLLEIINRFQPQNIYLPASSEIHPDHRVLYKAGTEAAKRYKPNINLIYNEIGQMQSTNLLHDITDLHEQLNRAMDCFKSQLAVLDYKRYINALHIYRSYTLGEDVKYAEAYHFVNSKNIKTGSQLWKQKTANIELPIKTETIAESPLLSVIVRTMNRPELAEALESISKQTYPNLEVIVVDALGTGKLNLGNHCGNFPLRIISKNKQLPRAAAANVGLQAVEGEYFCFLDEDDLLFAEHFSKLINVLKNSNHNVAYSNIKRVNSKNELIDIYNENFNFHKLFWENFIPIHSLIFRAKPIKPICSFDDKFEIYEDWDFLLQVGLLGEFVHINKITGIYRDTNISGAQHNEEKITKFRTLLLEKWKDKLPKKHYIGFLNYLSSLNLREKEHYRSKFEETQNKIKLLQEKNKQVLQKSETFLAEAQAELEKLGKRLNKNDAVIEQLTGSLSWRITKPLRLLNRENLKSKFLFINNKRKIKMSGLFDKEYYLQNNPELKQSGIDALNHFMLFGGFEDRNPGPHFNSRFYLNKYADVEASGINPLLHYVLYGKIEGRVIFSEDTVVKSNQHKKSIQGIKNLKSLIVRIIKLIIYNKDLRLISQSKIFNYDYYLRTNADVKAAGLNAVEHYYFRGWKEGRDPSKEFDTNFYITENKDVQQLRINPLLHYIKYGKTEGRIPKDNYKPELKPQDVFEKADTSHIDLSKSPVKTIAFYLPQFHPIPENDEWWGKGFTEWTNVTKAKPLFQEHYQPHLPLDLGFYDLRNPDIMEQQIEMAKSFGINGFCFYYYWFDGKRLLEKPLDMFLQHPEWDINFCLCWANENWTRQWIGDDNEVLIAQNHSPEDDIGFIKDTVKYIDDPRYITIDDKPLMIIYRPQLFPDIKATVNRWRKFYKDNFNKELYLTMVQTFGKYNPNEFGFDAAIEFPPHNISPKKITSDFAFTNFTGNIYDARSVINNARNTLAKVDYEVFRGVMLNWDNTARRGLAGDIFLHNTPSVYGSWLTEAFNDTLKHKTNDSKKFVFINAWNEWGEGTHLEPDQKYGYSYLNATKQAIGKTINNPTVSAGRILFVSHDAFFAGAQLILLNTVKWLSKNTSLKLKVLFIAGGKLLGEFSKYAETHVLTNSNNGDELREIEGFMDKDTNLIYMNSVASGKITKTLSQFNIPVLLHVHELQKSIEVYAEGYIPDILKYTSHYIACSKAVYKNLNENYKIDTNQINVVHEYVKNEVKAHLSTAAKEELKKKLGLPLNKKLVFGVGLGLFWRKGADIFIDVCNYIKQTQNSEDIMFLWIGDFVTDEKKQKYGAWADHYKKIEKLGLEKNIQFIGTKNNIRDYLQTGELFLLPSREDPFPLVCLEAADCYLPVVCFADAGGMPEFVQDDAGFVVPFEDTSAMAEKVLYLLNNEKDRAKRGKVAHDRFVENFSIGASMGKILKTIRTVGSITPLVSVIVPNFNYARYLPQRLESIYNQTFQDFEVIILDDCSSDNSLEVIEKYRDRPSTSIIVNEKNSGSVFHQWKKGVEMAKGKYIWIAEADDYCENTFLEKLLPAFTNNNVNIAYCNSNAVNADGIIEKDFYNKCGYYNGLGYKSSKWENDYINNGIDEIKNVLAIKNTIPNCSAMIFRKEAFLKSDLSKIENLKCNHDWLTYVNLIKDGMINYYAQPLNYHRRHDQSVISKNAKGYKKTISEYFLSHLYIAERFNISDNVKQKMESLLSTNLKNNWKEIPSGDIRRCYPLNKQAFSIIEKKYKHKNSGFCPVCKSNTVFYSNEDWLRDHYRCMNCNSIPRERALFHVLDKNYDNWQNKKIHESSPSNRHFKNVVEQYSFSQYYHGHKPGSHINGIRNEDLEKLTFPDNSFDFFITLDVLEHVFNPDVAIREMLRTITSDGAVVFTVPIHKQLMKSVQRAVRFDDNPIKYLLPEEYHGNPVGDGRSLVTWDYGQDFKSLVQKWIGSDYEIKRVNQTNDKLGIIGECLDVFLIVKP